MNALASAGQLRASFLRWVLVLVPGVELLGFVSGQMGGDARSAWFRSLAKPDMFPPPAVFGIVWPILFALIALALAVLITARGAAGRTPAIAAWIITFVLILGWSPLFFGAHQITLAFGLLLAIDAAALIATWLAWRVRPLAGWLMLPFLLWVVFAAALNYQFMTMNPDADGRAVSGAVERVAI